MAITRSEIENTIDQVFEDLDYHKNNLKQSYLTSITEIINQCKNINSNMKAIDIGGGIGITSSILKRLTDVDIDIVDFHVLEEDAFSMKKSAAQVQAFYEKEGIGFKAADFERDKLPYEDNSLDIILCEHVIEHLKNPKNILSECMRCLKKDGIFWCSTPNAFYLPKRVVFLKGKSPMPPIEVYYEQGLKFTDHIREYSLDELKKVIRLAGFLEVSVKTYTPYNNIWKLIGKFRPTFSQVIGVFASKT